VSPGADETVIRIVVAIIDPEGELPYPLAQLAQRHALPLARQLKLNGRKYGPWISAA
jgi:hypothetical protein